MFNEREDEFDDDEMFEIDDEMGDSDDEMDDDEVEELSLELLEVQDDEELDEFLNSVVGRATQTARRFARSKRGRQLIRYGRTAAKKALPWVGGYVGGRYFGPTGRKVGRALGGAAAQLLEHEGQDLEEARRFVKMMGTAAKKAAQAPSRIPPTVAAKQAIASASRRYMTKIPSPRAGGGRRSGRWYRRGNSIVVTLS